MAFHLEKETSKLRQELFEQLSTSTDENRPTLLKIRDLLWEVSTSLVFKDKNEQELGLLYDEALCLMFQIYNTML